jgi:hypothetical protein
VGFQCGNRRVCRSPVSPSRGRCAHFSSHVDPRSLSLNFPSAFQV